MGKKYVIRKIERFDQINTMTRRVYADPAMKDSLESWSSIGEFKQDPAGHTQRDYALRWSSRIYHAVISVLNMSKPNPSPLSRLIKETMASSAHTLSYSYRSMDGLKIDTSDPEIITRDLKKAATFYGADIVGTCELDRRWLYSHTCNKEVGDSDAVEYKPQEIHDGFQYALVMGFEANYDMLRYLTTQIGGAAQDMASARMTITSALVTAFIRNLGFQAIDCTIDDVAIAVPMAMQAGLGDLGRHGQLITPRFGPRVRLSLVITDLPLVTDSPIDFGVTEFCEKCKKCAERCPSEAISHEDRTTEPINISNAAGALKWPMDAEKCRMYPAKVKHPCDTCVVVCPYNKPDTLFHRSVRWLTDHVRWGDPLYIWADDLLGYGNPKQADNFWEKWKPVRGM
jgi:reductive dehalogenase